MIINIKASLKSLFSKGSTVNNTSKAIVPNFDKGACRCEQLGFDFSDKGLTEGVAVINRKINNLHQFLIKLEITDEEIDAIANGTISDVDKHFLIFHHL